MLSEKQLDILRERRAKVLAGGGEDKLQERHAKGLLGARERLLTLFQPDTFQEIATHAKHAAKHFGLADKELPSDGVVVGTGFVDGRPVAAFSQDFTVMGGTLGKMHAKKIVQSMQLALKIGAPVVAFKDSAGARIQEAVDALSGYGEVFYNNVLLSGVVPQIAIIAGPCAGGASYSPALMDFIIMTKQNAYMFITGPEVIKAVTGRTTSLDEVGSAQMHATISGNVHFVAEDDRHAIQIAKELLSYLPSNNTEDPPHQPYPDLDLSSDEGINALIPDTSSEPMDVQPVIKRLVDNGQFLEVHAGWAGNIVVGFRPHPGHRGRHPRQPVAGQGRSDGHRLLRQGRALHPFLQCLQHPAGHAGGRARLPARHRAGARRHHSPRRQDALHLRLGHRAQDHHHPAQGLRRLLSGDVRPGNGRRSWSSPGRPRKSR